MPLAIRAQPRLWAPCRWVCVPHRAHPPLLLLLELGCPVLGWDGTGWPGTGTHGVSDSAQPLALLPGAVWGLTPARLHSLDLNVPPSLPTGRTSATIKAAGSACAPCPLQLHPSLLDFITQQQHVSAAEVHECTEQHQPQSTAYAGQPLPTAPAETSPEQRHQMRFPSGFAHL